MDWKGIRSLDVEKKRGIQQQTKQNEIVIRGVRQIDRRAQWDNQIIDLRLIIAEISLYHSKRHQPNPLKVLSW